MSIFLTRWLQVQEPGQSGSMLPSSATVLQKGYYAMVELVLGVDEARIRQGPLTNKRCLCFDFMRFCRAVDFSVASEKISDAKP